MDDFTPSDTTILDFLRERDSATVAELADAMDVTATAVRQRLLRLLAQGLVERTASPAGRGRPVHQYRLTAAGRRQAGVNFADLAVALWAEICALDDQRVKERLIEGISRRLARLYAASIQGDSLEERMQALAELFSGRRMPCTVESEGGEPVLRVLACPYPEIAEQDRTVCSMERELFREVLGEEIELGACRLDGDSCCCFEASAAVGD